MASQGETTRAGRYGRRSSRTAERIGDVLANLLARRGYARVESASACTEAWQEAAGEKMAQHSRVGNVRRGVLEVTVRNSAVLQELTFQKTQLLGDLGRLLADQKIRDLRFRIGTIE